MASRSLDRTRTELSAFLRAHRERLAPADVGTYQNLGAMLR